MKFKGIVPSHLAVLSVATALSTICLVSGANAAGFALNEQSTTGTGMAYAGVAAGGALSDMFWNPATLGDVKGLSFESDLTGILPGLNVTTNSLGPLPAQSQGTVGIGGVVPASYSAYRLNQNVIFGLGINAPFGLATGYNQATSYLANIPGSAPPKAIASGTRVFSLDVNPNVAYQFNNQLTIAVGLQVQYMELTETGFGQPTGAYFGKSKNLGYGYTLGVDWKPMQGTTFGLGYRSGISNGVSGNLAGVLVAPATYMSFAGDIALNTPGMVSFGASQVLDDKWTLRGGATYTNWSTLGTATVTGPAAAVVTASLGSNLLPFNYKDSYSVSTGAEYKWNDSLTLRSGIAYETSPIVNSNRSFRLPDSDRLWLSTGLSYAVTKQSTIDVGYSFLHGLGSTIGNFTLNGPFTGTFTSNTSIVSVAYRVNFD